MTLLGLAEFSEEIPLQTILLLFYGISYIFTFIQVNPLENFKTLLKTYCATLACKA